MIKRADLYLLAGSSFSDSMEIQGKVAEKAFAQQMPIKILSQSRHESEELAKHLWHSKPESFLPNQVLESESDDADAISISSNLSSFATKENSLLITPTATLNPETKQFTRVAFVVKSIESEVQTARETYRTLKSEGIEVNIHDMRPKT